MGRLLDALRGDPPGTSDGHQTLGQALRKAREAYGERTKKEEAARLIREDRRK